MIVDVARKLTSPLQIGGYELPAGSYVMAAISALHYREDLFPQPQEFRPERFLDARGPSENPRVRLASAGPSGARTQGGRIAALFGRPRTPHRAGPPPPDVRGGSWTGPKPDTYAWIPFGGGVRRCIGAAFAEYEMKIVLRAFLERAELSAPSPKPERVVVRNITLAPSKGTVVRLDRPLG